MAISAYSLAAWSLCSYLLLLSGQRVWWLKLKCLRKGSINDDIDLEKGLHRRGSFNDMQCITGRLLRDTSLRYAFSALWFYACAIQHKKDFTMHHKTTLPTFWRGIKRGLYIDGLTVKICSCLLVGAVSLRCFTVKELSLFSGNIAGVSMLH